MVPHGHSNFLKVLCSLDLRAKGAGSSKTLNLKILYTKSFNNMKSFHLETLLPLWEFNIALENCHRNS